MIRCISKFAAVAALILGGVVLAACGGDDESGTVTRLGTPPVEADPVGFATVEMAPGETAQEIAVVLDPAGGGAVSADLQHSAAL